MNSYVEDNLIKHNCDGCKGDFILSEYQMSNANKKIICPYCSCERIRETIKYNPSESTIDIPGCISIGHFEDPQREREDYEYTWGRIMEAKINNLIRQITGGNPKKQHS